jgi:DNA-binding response OmpR family regulator
METEKKPQYDVLIADDDSVLRQLLSTALQKAGFIVAEASDADGVIACMHGPGFVTLVTDINMPGNASLEILPYLAQEKVSHPVILMTGEPTVETAIKAVGLNAYHYLVKPFAMSEFVALVKEACRLGRLRDSVNTAREDFSHMSSQLALMQEQLNSCNKPDVDTGTMEYLTLVMNSVLHALQGGSGLVAGDKSRHVTGGAEAADLQMLTSALKETVCVLENTKSAFKSKELGLLRKKLNLALELVE